MADKFDKYGTPADKFDKYGTVVGTTSKPPDIWPDPKRKVTGVGKTGVRLKGSPGANKLLDPIEAGWNLGAQGIDKLGTGWDNTVGGLSDMFRGTGLMFYPYVAGTVAGGGLPAVIGLGSAGPIGAGVEWGAKAAGVPEGTSQALGDISGLAGGYITSRLAGAFGRGVAPYAAKIPMLPAKWKAALKTIGYLTPEAKPTTTPGEYLKHTEDKPGGWPAGIGISGQQGTMPPWLSNLRNFTFEDMERKLRGQSAPPPVPSFQPESPLPSKRVGGFGSTGISGDRIPATPMVPRPTGFQAGNLRGLSPKDSLWGERGPVEPWEKWLAARGKGPTAAEPVAPSTPPPEGMYGTRRPPMGPPKTTYFPETLDVVPDPTAPRTLPPEAPSGSPMPTKRVGGFGRTATPRQNVQPRETMGPRESEPQEFKPTTIPEPPLPEDPVRGAEREAAEPQPEDAPPKFGTPEYVDWFTKTWPDLQLPKGASGMPEPPKLPEKLTAEEIEAIRKQAEATTAERLKAEKEAAEKEAAGKAAAITPEGADQARKTGTIPGTETPVDLDYVRRVAEQNEDTLPKTLNAWLHEAWKDAYGTKDAHRRLSDYLKGKYGLESMSGIGPEDALHEYHTLKDIAIKKHSANPMNNPPPGTPTKPEE